MGFKQISGIEWTCDHCGTSEVNAGDEDVNGNKILPKGWFGGKASQSDGDANTTTKPIDWVACKTSCIGNGIRKAIGASKPVVEDKPVVD